MPSALHQGLGILRRDTNNLEYGRSSRIAYYTKQAYRVTVLRTDINVSKQHMVVIHFETVSSDTACDLPYIYLLN